MRKELTVPLLTFAIGCLVGAMLNFQPTIVISQSRPIVFPQPTPKPPEPIIILGDQPLPKPKTEGCPVCGATDHEPGKELPWEQWGKHAGLSDEEIRDMNPDDEPMDPLEGLSAYQRGQVMKADMAAGVVDEKPSWQRTRAQGVLLGRMFSSEDTRALRRRSGGGTCGDVTADHLLIARVVMNNAESRSTFRGWSDVMRFLSPHVTASKELTRPRQRWTSTLPGYGDAMPSGWVDSRDVVDGEDNDGDWRVHGPCWVELRKKAIELWLTGPPFGDFPKDVKPKRWGNENDVITFFGKKNKKGRFYNRERFCVVPYGDLNFFIAEDGRGCTVGDAATVAAYEGKRPEPIVNEEESAKEDDGT